MEVRSCVTYSKVSWCIYNPRKTAHTQHTLWWHETQSCCFDMCLGLSLTEECLCWKNETMAQWRKGENVQKREVAQLNRNRILLNHSGSQLSSTYDRLQETFRFHIRTFGFKGKNTNRVTISSCGSLYKCFKMSWHSIFFTFHFWSQAQLCVTKACDWFLH